MEQQPQNLRVGGGRPTSDQVEQQEHQKATEETTQEIEGPGAEAHGEKKQEKEKEDVVDLDTKAQAVEAGAHPRDQRALDLKMEELGKGLQEKVVRLRAPEDLFDIEGLCRSSRFVIARIWSRDEKGEASELGYVCSAERLHNIKTKKGFTYGGKDDPVLLAFCQGDWPAPGEITSPWAACPMVGGRAAINFCRASLDRPGTAA